MITDPTKKGKEIERHLDNVSMESWFYIYENYVKNDSKEELNRIKKEVVDKIS